MIGLYHCLACREVFSRVIHAEEEDPGSATGTTVNEEWERHQDHPMELLTPMRGSSHCREPYDAPRRTVYFLATNGRERFLVVKRKPDRFHPSGYELRKGYILPLPPAVSLGEDDLLRQIIWEKKGSIPAPGEIAVFIHILRDCVSRVTAADLGDEEADLHHPLVSHARPPCSFFEEAARICRSSFPEEPARWFTEFLERHRDGHPPLALQVRRNFEVVEEQAGAGESIASPSGKALR